MLSLEFLTTALIVVLIPGTGVIYTLSHGLFLGRWQSVAAAVGCTAGIVPHLAASILGLAAILHTSALLFQAFKWAGAAYLLHMAWGLWQERGGLAVDNRGLKSRWWPIIRRGFLINILNPKLSIFFLAFLPLFVDPAAGSAAGQMVALSAVFMAMTLVVFIGYGLGASWVRRHLLARPAWVRRLQRGFAAAFAALGLKLALSDA